MESFISTAVFAVLFFASGVVGQTGGGIGQVCNFGNNCIATSTDVCGVNSICRRKVDATCASPNQNQCVVGAQCNGTPATCQCKTPAYVAGSANTDLGRCVPSLNFVGGTCSPAGMDRGTCWDTNSACTNNVCTCKAGYVRSTDGNTCVSGPSGGLGQVCNTALTCNASTTDVCGVNNICRRKVDATCASPNQNLCVLGAQCDVATTTCKCKPPTYTVGTGLEVGRCVPSPNYVGGTCSGSDRGTCLDANAVCVGGLCTCKTSYVRNSDTNSCVLAPTGGTGQACSSGNTCIATTTDVCGVNSICRRKVEAACSIPYTNLCVLGAQCDSATITCKCKTPAYTVGSGTDLGRCVPSPTYVGGTCSGLDKGTCLDASALCTNGICACRTGYARNTDGNTCMLGQVGTTGQACNFGSTPCNANTTDVCENNICKRRADANCVDPNQNQCVLGAQCESTTTTCKCRTPNFYAGTSSIDLGKCLPSPNYVGGVCTGPGRGSCTDLNALCTNGACQCKTSYVRNNDTYICYVLTGGTGQMCNPGSTCNATTTDVCENNFCKRRLGANCAYPNNNQCVLGAQCDSRTQTCACWTPYYTDGTSLYMGKCLPAQNYVGGTCAGTDKGTCLDRNAVCSAGICTCKTNYVRNTEYNACNGANGQTGGTGQLCNFGNICNATTTDVCENTVCKRKAGVSCASPYQDQCVLGAQCDANVCRCKTPQYTVGTSGANLGKCVPSQNYVGGWCSGPNRGTCQDPNAVCSGSVCTCKTSSITTTDNNTCDACSVILSVTLMLLGLIVTSRFL